MAVRQRIIAERIGVSRMTVSRARRGESGIIAETRCKTLEYPSPYARPKPTTCAIPSRNLVSEG